MLNTVRLMVHSGIKNSACASESFLIFCTSRENPILPSPKIARSNNIAQTTQTQINKMKAAKFAHFFSPTSASGGFSYFAAPENKCACNIIWKNIRGRMLVMCLCYMELRNYTFSVSLCVCVTVCVGRIWLALDLLAFHKPLLHTFLPEHLANLWQVKQVKAQKRVLSAKTFSSTQTHKERTVKCTTNAVEWALPCRIANTHTALFHDNFFWI